MKLKDPADANKEQVEQTNLEEEIGQLDPNRLTLDEIGSVPVSAERTPHPFAGYPLQRKIKIGETQISTTFIVILKDKNIFQDPSGRGVSHQVIAKQKDGKDVRSVNADGKFLAPKIESNKVINLETHHNRIASNHDDGSGQAMDWVFDRKVMVGEREMVCCVVPSHSARAQIVFEMVKGKIRVDKRYMLADMGQVGRLRRVFTNIKYQQLAGERAAQKFDSDPSDQDRQE